MVVVRLVGDVNIVLILDNSKLDCIVFSLFLCFGVFCDFVKWSGVFLNYVFMKIENFLVGDGSLVRRCVVGYLDM